MRINPFRARAKSFVPVDTDTAQDIVAETSAGVSLYESIFAQNSAIYSTQPAVRTCVDFLARNVAQVNLKLYNRVSDTERVELSTHPLTGLLQKPNPATTRYRMIYGTIADLALYDNAFWIKQRGQGSSMALVRVPPEYMSVYGAMSPKFYRLWFPGGDQQFFNPEDVVHFHGYHPTKLTTGVSPMETLKNVIAEDVAASAQRRGFWQRGARMEGIIMRPSSAPPLSSEGRKRFLEEWQGNTAGQSNAGKTGMLEEDMKWEPASFSPKDSEFIAGRQLTMGQVARAYHIPLPMVGLTDSANFASIAEYHVMLYQECLPPWMTWIQEDIELQLFPDFGGLGTAYAEFNLKEKLQGSFEQQAAILSSAVGMPYMTVEEARARLNLPNDQTSLDSLVQPLNVLIGGQPNPQTPTEVPTPDSVPPEAVKALTESSEEFMVMMKALAERQRDKYTIAHEDVLRKFFIRQRDSVLSSQKDAKPFDSRRWNKELRSDLTPLALATTTSAGNAAARKFGADYDPNMTTHYLDENVRIAAENVNASTKAALKEAGSDTQLLKDVFTLALDSRTPQLALSRATSLTSFATHEAAKQAGKGAKIWRVTADNSRHTDVDGEKVPLNTPFSNGLQYPGDPSAGPDETAGCQCLLEFGSS